MDRATKRARSAGSLHSGNISVAGLARMVERLPADGAHSHSSLRRANADLLNEVLCAEAVQLDDGSTFSWEFADPSKLLQTMVSSSRELQDIYLRAFREKPCSPHRRWSLVLGTADLKRL